MTHSWPRRSIQYESLTMQGYVKAKRLICNREFYSLRQVKKKIPVIENWKNKENTALLAVVMMLAFLFLVRDADLGSLWCLTKSAHPICCYLLAIRLGCRIWKSPKCTPAQKEVSDAGFSRKWSSHTFQTHVPLGLFPVSLGNQLINGRESKIPWGSFFLST